MTQSGYIYVLYNPSINGFVKIGKTRRNPDERAKELSSGTGVLAPFIVVYQSFFQDCDKAEIFIHSRLEEYRTAKNREFFQLPIYLAINTVLEAKKILEDLQNDLYELSNSNYEESEDDIFNVLIPEETSDPGSEIFEAAEAYYYGLGDTLQDYDEAFNLYHKAARLGSAEAYLQLGCMCRDGEGHSKDNRCALEFFREGIKHGNDECWAEMAQIFYLEGHKSNEEKCWSKYFSSKSFDNFSFRRSIAIYNYIKNCLLEVRDVAHKEQIMQVREEVVDFISQLQESVERSNGNPKMQIRCLRAIKLLQWY